MSTTPHTVSDTAAKKDVTKLQRAVVDGLEDVKAQDIQVFNTEHLSPLFERVIVATGSSNRQTKALAASVREAVSEAGFVKPRLEGEDNGEWIIVDCGQVVVHVMQPAIRQYYRLEEIWGEKPVRLKFAAAKPRKVTASESAPEGKAKAPAKKAPAKAPKTAKPQTPAQPAPAAVKKAPAKKAPAKTAARKTPQTTADKPRTAKTSAPKAAAKKVAIPTVVVNAPEAKKAVAKKAAAKKAPAKKVASKKAPASEN